ncbi:hypothetical protein NBZ79_11760 [Sneathiella marina]|uniref:Uncharacterized protein n=1 Tax=Sneathiella marina TaxID=2950108 RepID=A0ABY4VYE4_9PROT|nr:hypothetical protein [Sneathiella marina]USG59853.1 hypothetical protein NBZ79_11760 [Sneathiella marina]
MRENIAKKELEIADNAASLSKIKVRRPKDSANSSKKKAKTGDITDRLQALADELEATKPAMPVAEPVFEDTGTDLFEAPANKTPTSPAKKKRAKSKPAAEKPVPAPVPKETPEAPIKAKAPEPSLKKKEVIPPVTKPVVEAKKPVAAPPEKETPAAASAVPPRRANWARPASAPGWQKKVQTPDILSYWMEIRNGNRYPTWQNLDTQKIGKFWPNCVLVHCNHASGRLQLETSFSNELRHSAKRANPLRDFTTDIDFSPMVVDWVLSLARDVANTGKPAHGTEYFPSVFDETPLRVIALPLSENQVDVDHVLCYVQKLS